MLGQVQIAVAVGLSPSEARTAINERWRLGAIYDFARNKEKQRAAMNRKLVRDQLSRIIRTRSEIEGYIQRLNTGYRGDE